MKDIEFGYDYIKVNGKTFHLTHSSVKIIRKWYKEYLHDTEDDEEGRNLAEKLVECFAEIFELVSPENDEEAELLMDTLEFIDFFDPKIRKLFERMYNKARSRTIMMN